MLNRSLAILTLVVIVALATSSLAQTSPVAATTPQTPPGTRRPANTGGQTSTEPQSRRQQDPAQQSGVQSSGAAQGGSPPSAPATVPSGSRARRAEPRDTPGETPPAGSAGAAAAAASDPGLRGVRVAFDALTAGIRRSNVEVVMSGYWNSPQLVIFNHNGTVTKTWEQVRSNRASYYPNAKDVELEVRNVNAQMLGRDGAFVTCLWKQSQTFSGTPESASGRLTVVFRRIGGTWKAVHAHTSPDAPDASRVPPSERSESPASTPRTTPSSPTNQPATP